MVDWWVSEMIEWRPSGGRVDAIFRAQNGRLWGRDVTAVEVWPHEFLGIWPDCLKQHGDKVIEKCCKCCDEEGSKTSLISLNSL